MTTATAVEFDFDKKIERTIPAALARESCKTGMFCWIDLDAAADPSGAENVLRDMGVNDHAIKEALGPDQDGRYDPYEDCLHTAVTSVDFKGGKLKASHVDVIIGENFLVSNNAEVEALISKDISYVTEEYVPSRLREADFLD